jgi:hypothetical protein
MKNYIGISRDHSGSMSYIARAAARDYNANISSIRDAANKSNIETLVSVVECGYGRTNQVRREMINENVTSLRSINENEYSAQGGGTPLFDSVGELIEIFEAVQKSTPKVASIDPYTAMGKEELRAACRSAGVSYSNLNNEGMRNALRAALGVPTTTTEDISFLVMAVTDGQENASRRYNARSIAEKIQQLQATDRWTFVFRVPRGHSHELVRMGIPAGNILEWDQTERGVEVATRATAAAFDEYYDGRTRGFTSTKSFYNTDMSNISKATVKAKLIDITKEVQFFDVPNMVGLEIRKFVELKTGQTMVKGSAFYQLIKTESEVQDYKQIAIRDKKGGHVYSGAEARKMLGLPYNGTVKIVPGNHGAYDIFIQSTSVNRKLVPGTQVMYWPKVSV